MDFDDPHAFTRHFEGSAISVRFPIVPLLISFFLSPQESLLTHLLPSPTYLVPSCRRPYSRPTFWPTCPSTRFTKTSTKYPNARYEVTSMT